MSFCIRSVRHLGTRRTCRQATISLEFRACLRHSRLLSVVIGAVLLVLGTSVARAQEGLFVKSMDALVEPDPPALAATLVKDQYIQDVRLPIRFENRARLVSVYSVDLGSADAQLPIRTLLAEKMPEIELLPADRLHPSVLAFSASSSGEADGVRNLVYWTLNHRLGRPSFGAKLSAYWLEHDSDVVLGKLEYTVHNKSYFNTLRFSAGYGQSSTGNTSMVPLTLSLIRDIPFRSYIRIDMTTWYFGYGVGLYNVQVQSSGIDHGWATRFGGFGVAGIRLSGGFFMEGSYHLVAGYAHRNFTGFELSLGYRAPIGH